MNLQTISQFLPIIFSIIVFGISIYSLFLNTRQAKVLEKIEESNRILKEILEEVRKN